MNFFKKKEVHKVVTYSNVIQFDDMGYPLRLVIDNLGKQIWLDTLEMDGDVILNWTTPAP